MNHASVDMGAILFDFACELLSFPFVFLFNRKRYFDLQKYRKYLKRVATLQRMYAKKEDVSAIPSVYYAFSEYCLLLKIHLNHRATDKEYERIAEEVKTITGLYQIDYKLTDGNCYMELGRIEDNSPTFVYQDTESSYKVPLGREYGKTVEWEFSKMPHILAVGKTGSGKSVFIKYILSSLLRFYEVDCIDGKEVDYVAFADLFYHYAGVMRKEEAMQIVQSFYDVMTMRYAKLKELKVANAFDLAPDLPFKPRFLLIDEFTSLVESLDKKEKEVFLTNIGHIARLGRAVGMNLIIAMQRPDTRFISGEIRENLTNKVVMGNASDETYRMVYDRADLQSLKDTLGKGYVEINGELHQIAVPYQKDIDLG